MMVYNAGDYAKLSAERDALAAELADCAEVRNSWCIEYTRVRDELAMALTKLPDRIGKLEATVQLIMNTVAGWEFVPATDFQLISMIAHAANVPYSTSAETKGESGG